MIDLYKNAYDFIGPLMVVSGLASAATLDRLTILGRPKLIIIGLWLACAALVLVGIGLMLDVRGTMFGEIILGSGDVVMTLGIPTIIGGYWWETRREFAARRAEYFNKTKKGGAK